MVGRPLPATLRAGVVGRPHGLDGSFHVRRPRPGLLLAGGEVEVAGVWRRITRRVGTEEAPIVRLEGIEGREGAAAATGSELRVARTQAPALGEQEWYAEELEGCRVTDGGRELGEVRRLLVLPSCEVLEVARVDTADLLVPLIADAVREVDVEERRIDVDLRFLGED